MLRKIVNDLMPIPGRCWKAVDKEQVWAFAFGEVEDLIAFINVEFAKGFPGFGV